VGVSLPRRNPSTKTEAPSGSDSVLISSELPDRIVTQPLANRTTGPMSSGDATDLWKKGETLLSIVETGLAFLGRN